MRNRIAQNADAGPRIETARRVLPILQIGQRVNLFRGFLFHVIANGVTSHRGMEPLLVQSAIQAPWVRFFAPLRLTRVGVLKILP